MAIGEGKKMKNKNERSFFASKKVNKERELECVYARWIALKLVKKGYKIIKWGINEYHPQFEKHLLFLKTSEESLNKDDLRRIKKAWQITQTMS